MNEEDEPEGIWPNTVIKALIVSPLLTNGPKKNLFQAASVPSVMHESMAVGRPDMTHLNEAHFCVTLQELPSLKLQLPTNLQLQWSLMADSCINLTTKNNHTSKILQNLPTSAANAQGVTKIWPPCCSNCYSRCKCSQVKKTLWKFTLVTVQKISRWIIVKTNVVEWE